MSKEPAQVQSALDEILPGEAPEHVPAERPRDVFKPWHLPRKHHVRKAQWASALNRLLDDIPDRRLIKYLCLPGEDLLDVEALAAVCHEKQRRLKYLGFDQDLGQGGRSTQRIASEQILRQSLVVDDTSVVLPDDFTSIARCDSIGNRRLRDGGSYDVVNLDMCDAFTTHEWAPTHAAILQLLTHQSNHRGEPWLLFLTTRSEVGRLQRPELDAYAQAIAENANQSADFCRYMADLAGDEPGDVGVLLGSIQNRMQTDTYLSGRWLTIGIGKWLLGIMGAADPWRVDLLSAFSYRTGLLSDEGPAYAGEPPNLFSVVFRFEKVRQARQDPAGLAPEPSVAYAPFNELRLAEKLARSVVQQTVDLDRLMAENPETHCGLSSECESLLSVRYYSVEAYRAWVGRLPPVAG